MAKDSATVASASATPAKTRSKPKGGSREAILRAAERLFAREGYDRCSIRQISERSGVNQGLVHYHFKSKENLFVEMFMRRGKVIAEERMQLLDAAEQERPGRPVPLEALIRCFVTPPLRLAQSGAGGLAFNQIQARMRSEPGALSMRLRSRLYDESSFRYIDALCKTLPHLDRDTICWRFYFMIGVYLAVLTQTGRLEALSRGSCNSTDIDAALAQVVPFLVAGFAGRPDH
jgi:AcrR family transcriptional regulator